MGADDRTLSAAIAVLAAFILVFALFARVLKERIWLTEPLAAVALGAALSASGALHLEAEGTTRVWLEELTRMALAVQVVGVMVRLPRGYPCRAWRSLALLLLVAMPAAALAGAGVARLAGGLPVTLALLCGAALAPTDPVLASDVVTGRTAERSTSPRWRHLLLAESAANDGLAYPLVAIPASVAGNLGHTVAHVLLWDVLTGGAVGAVVGGAVAWTLRWLHERDAVEREGHFALTLALALTAAGAARVIDADGVFAAFCAGAVFSAISPGEMREPRVHVHSAVDRFFTPAIFIVFGAALPWSAWAAHPARFLLVAAGFLVVRRLPFVLLLAPLIPRLRTWRGALLFGWMGPMGAAGILYALIALRRPSFQPVWSVVSAVVLASVVVHGLSASPLMRWLGRDWRESRRRAGARRRFSPRRTALRPRRAGPTAPRFVRRRIRRHP